MAGQIGAVTDIRAFGHMTRKYQLDDNICAGAAGRRCARLPNSSSNTSARLRSRSRRQASSTCQSRRVLCVVDSAGGERRTLPLAERSVVLCTLECELAVLILSERSVTAVRRLAAGHRLVHRRARCDQGNGTRPSSSCLSPATATGLEQGSRCYRRKQPAGRKLRR